jgi:hypothetical protein
MAAPSTSSLSQMNNYGSATFLTATRTRADSPTLHP